MEQPLRVVVKATKIASPDQLDAARKSLVTDLKELPDLRVGVQPEPRSPLPGHDPTLGEKGTAVDIGLIVLTLIKSGAVKDVTEAIKEVILAWVSRNPRYEVEFDGAKISKDYANSADVKDINRTLPKKNTRHESK